MGGCLSCLKGRQKNPETEPLLYEGDQDAFDEPTPKLRDLEAVVAFVSNNFVDIGNLATTEQPLSEPQREIQLKEEWVWPELGPLGQHEQLVDQVYSTLGSLSTLDVDTTDLSVDIS